MPYLFDQTEEELKKQQADSGQPTQISGQSSIISQGGQQTAPDTQKTSGNFVNLQKYLDVNKDNTSGMAEKVVGDVGSSVEAANKAGTEYGTAVGGIKQDKTTAESLQTGFYNDPAKANKAEYDKLKANYKGPQQIEQVQGYEPLRTSANKAVENVGNLKSDTGVSNLLSQSYARPNYTGGSKTLDTSLVNRDVGSKQKLGEASTRFSGINDLLANQTTAAQGAIKTATENTAANQALIGQQEQAQVGGLYNDINSRVAGTKAGMLEKQNFAKSQMPGVSDYMDVNVANELGLQGGTNLWGVDLNKYLNVNPATENINANDVASQEERNRWSSLQALIGGQDQRIGAKGQDLNPLSFDTAGFQKEAASNEKVYNETMAKPVNQVINTNLDTTGLQQDVIEDFKNRLNTMNPNDFKQWLLDSGHIGTVAGQQALIRIQEAQNAFRPNQRIQLSSSKMPTNIKPSLGK